jgi:hypothetical protein
MRAAVLSVAEDAFSDQHVDQAEHGPQDAEGKNLENESS